ELDRCPEKFDVALPHLEPALTRHEVVAVGDRLALAGDGYHTVVGVADLARDGTRRRVVDERARRRLTRAEPVEQPREHEHPHARAHAAALVRATDPRPCLHLPQHAPIAAARTLDAHRLTVLEHGELEVKLVRTDARADAPVVRDDRPG